MAAQNDMSTLVGLFKEAYGSKVIPLTGNRARLCKLLGFVEGKLAENGNLYHQPVVVTNEHGFTAAAANSTPTLLAASSGQMQDAQIAGSQIIGRSNITYEALARAAEGGLRAFTSATKQVVMNLSNTAAKRRELQLLHGQMGIGTLSSISGSLTTRVVVLSVDSWSPGIWAGETGATLDFFAAGPAGLKLNTNAPLVLTAVNPSTRAITVTGNASDLTTLDSTSAAVFFWETHSATTEAAGLNKILSNTGTLFNIDAATYPLWAGNVYSTSTGDLTLAKILDAVADPASYGADGKMLAIIAPKAFEQLNVDAAALRKFDVSYSSSNAKQGHTSLTFYSQNGEIEIMPHPLQKNGHCYIITPEETKRIGAQDISFIKRHGSNETLILESSTTPASEMRVYNNEALLVEQPKHTAIMTGITYS